MDGKMAAIRGSGSDALSHNLRLFQPRNAVIALGLTVNYLMKKAPFDRLPFGDWSRILVGQIDRGHYRFVVGANNQIQGFAGWGLPSKENAEAWLAGGCELSNADCIDGDCIVFNVWTAHSLNVHRFMVDRARELIKDRQTVYFRRFYSDGRVRPVRLNVTEFISAHIARAMAARDEAC